MMLFSRSFPTIYLHLLGLSCFFASKLQNWHALLLLLATVLSGKTWLWITSALWIAHQLTIRRCFIFRAITTLPRDLRGICLLIRLRIDILKRMRENRPLHHYFLETVRKYPDRTALIDIKNDNSWTFAELNQLANKFANYFHKKGYKRSDVIGLYMGNCPEFVAVWLGLSKLGVITAWINYNLTSEPLAHSIATARNSAIICTPSLRNAITDAMNRKLLSFNYKIFVYGHRDSDTSKEENIGNELESISDQEPPIDESIDFKSIGDGNYDELQLTLGNLGSNPTLMQYNNFYWIAKAAGEAFGISSRDRLYITMPLYHTSAGILGVGQVLIRGCSAVIRDKFSASNFWKDCCRFECSVSQYIGEMCRYLLAQSSGPEEKQHPVRLMVGNGLRPHLWTAFVQRFRVARIGELYGSTEGTSNLVNTDNHSGSCGFFPIYSLFSIVNPLRLIKIDVESGEIVRDRNGVCISCRPGETGEMVSIIRRKDPLFDFVGYVDKKDTCKKVIRDVFTKGDEAFTSGDILTWDEYGYLYFTDRRGDSYRWKGENVSCSQVEAILQPVSSIVDVVVFGVLIPGIEGRAGMAVISRLIDDQRNEQTFMKMLVERLRQNLPSYAIPVFVRLCAKVDRTGTFKLKKNKLQMEGFVTPSCSGDTVYFFDAFNANYRCLTEEVLFEIANGSCKLF